jgi:hypothetical protein
MHEAGTRDDMTTSNDMSEAVSAGQGQLQPSLPHSLTRSLPHSPTAHLGGRMELRMSSVCVVLRSAAAAFFFLDVAPVPLPLPLPLPVVLTSVGVLYFTRDTLLSMLLGGVEKERER